MNDSKACSTLLSILIHSPLELYRRVAEHRLDLSRLRVFALDVYVGVPLEEPRSCANVIRRAVFEPQGAPPERYFSVSFPEPEEQGSVLQHWQRVERSGELDVIVLDRGQTVWRVARTHHTQLCKGKPHRKMKV